MLAAFPHPLPDELLYSICARYAHRLQYPYPKIVMNELFGGKTFHAVIDFPGYLDELVKVLPPERGLTVNYFINAHSLFPAYAPFQPVSRARRARESMEGQRQARAYVQLGLWGCGVSNLRRLRYCPICAVEDRKVHGEAYWHRLHQISCVEVCPTHQVFLEDSQIRIDDPSFRRQLFSADSILDTSSPRSLHLTDPHHQIFVYIATEIEWLLEHPSTGIGSEELYWRYRQLVKERSLLSCTGKVLGKKLSALIIDYYGTDLLEKLQSGYDPNRGRNWLMNLLIYPHHSAHPVRHLLLMRFLGHTVRSMLEFDKEPEPFGEGPWPCLNRAADHYGQEVVTECKITCRGWERRKPLGIFTCRCGFSYSRPGPDSHEDDRYKYTRVKAFGPIWLEALRQLWLDPTIATTALAKRLGVKNLVADREARKMGLPMSRPSHGSSPTSSTKPRLQVPFEERQHTYRQVWREALRTNPSATRSELRWKASTAYNWLRKHDKDWLEMHRPAPHAFLTEYATKRVDWAVRDRELSRKVGVAAGRVLTKGGKPVRLTQRTLAREIGHAGMILSHKTQLPLTIKAIEAYIETHESFALRRIKWTTRILKE